ncbi:MAG: hypothetical protein Q8K37_00905 [Alphaproteobacteria bacterium]|nr:hypothetical protein [Alphaproteobacteria bacterium]
MIIKVFHCSFGRIPKFLYNEVSNLKVITYDDVFTNLRKNTSKCHDLITLGLLFFWQIFSQTAICVFCDLTKRIFTGEMLEVLTLLQNQNENGCPVIENN